MSKFYVIHCLSGTIYALLIYHWNALFATPVGPPARIIRYYGLRRSGSRRPGFNDLAVCHPITKMNRINHTFSKAFFGAFRCFSHFHFGWTFIFFFRFFSPRNWKAISSWLKSLVPSDEIALQSSCDYAPHDDQGSPFQGESEKGGTQETRAVAGSLWDTSESSLLLKVD